MRSYLKPCIEAEDLYIVTNEDLDKEYLMRSREIDGHIVLFDYKEDLHKTNGDPYTFSLKKASTQEKEQWMLDTVKQVMVRLVEEVNKEMRSQIRLDIDSTVFWEWEKNNES